LVLACPYKGRAIPFHFISYSSRTLGQESTSRNLEHKRALREVKGLIGDRPVVLDREFSYETFLEASREEGLRVIIRLNASSRVSIRDEEGEEISLVLRPGERVIRKGVYYKGRQEVNLVGQWGRGFAEPLWLITTLEPEEALKKYPMRMKVEECFRDLKDKLGMGQVMSKKRENMEKMVALLMIAYALAVLIGEEVRERLSYHTKELYSGIHILLRQRLPFIPGLVQGVINNVLSFLLEKTYCTVRTCV
ncbi:MAG: transposase, partial [Candidatus Brocadiales bacterium]